MLGRLPRRFRSRALLALVLLGGCWLVTIYYSPVPDETILKIIPQSQTSAAAWWKLWWSAPDNCKKNKNPRPESERVVLGDIYPKLDFGVPDNRGIGIWNETLENRYRKIRETWKDLPLKVIIVPHSHTDPGWLRTYDDYSDNYVNHILDNMVLFLNKTEDFKFIWSEISFFSKWWHRQSFIVQNMMKRILERKQLEIVTGGWVMADEATTSYFAVIDQLVEGHQWLNHFIKIKPQNGWSVDVFGHSATMPYLLSLAGISNMVILRAHYAIKKLFSYMKWFDFYWEQPFDSPRVLCHMAPSDLYSFKHVCGPDPFVCLKFDFRQVGGEYSESTSDAITEQNVELKANYLLSQYGRYASLFEHNVLLVPLGDDFRYNVYIEWVQQYENYKKLMNYINNRHDWHVEVKFGTLSDYFHEVHERLKTNVSKSVPSVQGDFFPYADIYVNSRPSYWTGFYSTRPFYKKLAQELEHWLRTAEILYSFAKTIVAKNSMNMLLKDYNSLSSARQHLGLFQHHDAITGTSKEMVMSDYGRKLHSGVIDAMSVVSHASQFLLMENIQNGRTWTSQIFPDVYRASHTESSKKLSIVISENGRKIIVFNSLTCRRTEIIRIKVRSPQIKVFDSMGNDVPSQINPVWKDSLVISNSVFELVFAVRLQPLSFSTFTLAKNLQDNSLHSTKAVISLFLKDDVMSPLKNSAFKFEKPNGSDILVESAKLSARFTRNGILKEIHMKDAGVSREVGIDFYAYIPKEYQSGAYLFYPEFSEAIPLSNLSEHFPLLCLIRGSVVSELNIVYYNFLKFAIRLYHFEDAPAGLQVEISSDLSKINKDIELIMRIKSDLKSSDTFYTDSNGFQMLKRKYLHELPVQGNYYPATNGIFIEDEKFRLNLLIPYSHGVTSPTSGVIEVMLDRKMRNDDGRGMGEGVEDNRSISATYWLIPEIIDAKTFQRNFLSPEAFLLSLCLQYPPVTLITENAEALLKRPHMSFLSSPWPLDVHLVNLRNLALEENYTIPSDSSLLIIYDRNDDCKVNNFAELVFEEFNVAMFSEVHVNSIEKTTLTGTEEDIVSIYSSSSKLRVYKITFS
ncbi:alpha-mannosidase 2-like [Stegodyphus dumicola]|uniref:alpha-mannosidase 2-like n=1 Tax=Stegodyphus dumicola TaxID=202533 RepID=UPI0015AEC481|nr:alpha-mannosidase 2-like [Stegodyphus dumicola]